MKSSIPDTIVEVVTGIECECAMIDCMAGNTLVGFRARNRNGVVEWEYGICRGKKHGYERYWSPTGRLMFERRFTNGRQCGYARQWSSAGRILGAYLMKAGTGREVWRDERGRILEERYYRDGVRHGRERWWNEDQMSIHIERYWWRGNLHGIEREWATDGALKRGFPKFFINGKRVSKSTYLCTQVRRRSLSRYKHTEDSPVRISTGRSRTKRQELR